VNHFFYGYGNMGRKHCTAVSQIPISRIFGTDIDHKKSKDFHWGDFSLPPNNTNVVTIATPKETHLSVLKDCFRLCEPHSVVIEKPCGNSFSECEEIIQMCMARGVRLYVNYQRRFDPLLRCMSIECRELSIECYRDFEWACHLFDMQNWYRGHIFQELSQDKVFVIDGVVRRLDRAILNLYQEVYGITDTYYACTGYDALYPHYVREYVGD
jgi:hypothetical protein